MESLDAKDMWMLGSGNHPQIMIIESCGSLIEGSQQVLNCYLWNLQIKQPRADNHPGLWCGPCVASDPLCPRPEHFGRIVAEQVKTSN